MHPLINLIPMKKFQLALAEVRAAHHNLSRMTSLAEEAITPPVSVYSVTPLLFFLSSFSEYLYRLILV